MFRWWFSSPSPNAPFGSHMVPRPAVDPCVPGSAPSSPTTQKPWWRQARKTPAKPAFLAPHGLLPDALTHDHAAWFNGLSPAEQADVLGWLTKAAQAHLRASMANPYAPVPGLGVVISAHLRQAHADQVKFATGPNRFVGLTYTSTQAADRTGLAPKVPEVDPPPARPRPSATVSTMRPLNRASQPEPKEDVKATAEGEEEYSPMEAYIPPQVGGFPHVQPEPLTCSEFEDVVDALVNQLAIPDDGQVTKGFYSVKTGKVVPLDEEVIIEASAEEVVQRQAILDFETLLDDIYTDLVSDDVSASDERIHTENVTEVQPEKHTVLTPERHRVLVSAPVPLAYGENRATFTQLVSRLEDGLLLSPFPAQDVMAQLRAEFPWAQDALAPLEEAMILGRYVSQTHLSLPPLLLVGPPGCGKTRLSQRLGDLIGVPTWSFSAAGRYGGHALVGTDRHWINAQASGLLQFMAHRDTANPLVVVDEIDKAISGGQAGDLGDTLLPLLERQSAQRVNDPYLMADVDLSRVCWIATANDTSTLSSALLSRLTVINLERPRRAHVPALIEGVRADLATSLGVSVEALPPWSEADTATVAQQLPGAFSAREVGQAVRRLLIQRARGAHLSLVPPTSA